MNPPKAKEPDFERWVSVHELPASGLDVEFAAETAELEAIVRRLDVLSVESLRIKATVRGLEGGKVVEIAGVLTALVTQECVATLEPLERVYDEPLKVLFMDPARARRDAPVTGEEVMVDPEEDDIEVLVDEAVDIGEVAVQYLSLALDPYPRKQEAPDVEWQAGNRSGEAEEEVRENPFSVLNKLRDKT